MAAGGDPALLAAVAAAAAASGDSKQLSLSALGDFARYAQHMEASGSAAKLNRMKESKVHSGSGEMSKDADIRRPSVIQKNVVDSKSKSNQQSSAGSSTQGTAAAAGLGPPPPAHSQKPVTLPSIPAGEVPASEQLRQWYAQMLSDKATGGNPLPASAAAMLELTLRPPTPAAATPSIFVPSRRIYVDPNLDIKRNRTTSAAATTTTTTGSAIPAAHTKVTPQPPNQSNNNSSKTQTSGSVGPPPLQNITPPRPAPPPPQVNHASVVRGGSNNSTSQSSLPPARSSVIPLVDLISRSINNMKQEDHHSSRKGSQSMHPAQSFSHMEINGKPLLDLSAHHQKLPGLPNHWNNAPRSGDVSLNLNVKIEGGSEGGKTAHPIIINAILLRSFHSSKKKRPVLGIGRRRKLCGWIAFP